MFLEGVDCVPVVLDGTLEVSFLWFLRGMVVSGMVGSRLSRYIVRSVRIYSSQDHLCRMLKNVGKRRIRSVSEGLRSYCTGMELCSESTKGV